MYRIDVTVEHIFHHYLMILATISSSASDTRFSFKRAHQANWKEIS